MSSSTSPITFSSGAVLTAAQLNTEIRDHLSFLKGFADLITSSTTADTGNATLLQILRPTGTDTAFRTAVTGDATTRFTIDVSGVLKMGGGTVAEDVNLYRASANVLKTDDDFLVGSTGAGLSASGFVSLAEITTPASAGANSCRLYAVDNGAGKTRLSVIFPTGAAQTIATEP